ncbi:hypothetical protein H4R34_003072 [Dimargaris verticillata]|uniref:HAD-like domain-containing protein n=1 Tax=Dimargaris verticillata TaxID=2761393 RepID=A0A9W8B5A0_9FUNG|nr:hypothetical protein H4R34_003072 [Dimargaris verticillata]
MAANNNAYPVSTHCIFDMDGLLLDTERIYTEVTQTLLDPYDCQFNWATKAKMMGRTTHDQSVRILLEDTKAPLTADEYIEKSTILQLERFSSSRPLPGVEQLIRHLKMHQVPIAVGTSSRKDIFDIKTKENQPLFALFDTITCGDDPNVKRGKPHPDIFQEAQRRLGNPPASQCLVFEDSYNGVQAAKRAGMHVVWIPDPNVVAMGLPADHGATEVIASMEEFDPTRYQLPGF